MQQYIKYVLIFLFLTSSTYLYPQSQEDISLNDLQKMSLEELMQLKIISATKKPDKVLEIPASFEIITRDDIEKMGYTNLEEFFMNQSGMYHIDNYEDYLIGVRGITGASIAFLVNGVQQHPIRVKPLAGTERSRMNIPLESIDRIEIIKGPMSVIYGNNAFLGAINIVTNETINNKVDVTIGNNNAQRGFLRYGQDYNDGNFIANLSWNRDDGINGKYSEMMSQEQLDFLSSNFPNGMHKKLDNHLSSESFNLDLSGLYNEITYNLRYSNLVKGFYLLTPGYHDGTHYHLHTFYGNLGLNKQISDNLNFKTLFTFSNESYEGDADFISPTITGHQLQNLHRIEGELILNYSNKDNFKITSGFQHLQLLHATRILTINQINSYSNSRNNDMVSNDLFANADIKLSESFKIIAGLRWSHIEPFKVYVQNDYNDPGAIIEVNRFNQDDILTPRAALIYNLNDHNIFKLMYGEATQNNSNRLLKEPEKIKTSEFNYLGSFSKFSLSASIFKNNISKIQRRFLRLDSTSVELLDNSGKWETIGFETAINYRPADNLDLQTSITIQETKDKHLNDVKIGYSPNSLAKFKISYNYFDFTLGAYVSYVDNMLSDYWQDVDTNQIQRRGNSVSNYTILGTNILFKPNNENWSVNLHAFNLLDNEIRYPANELADFQFGALGPGRLVTLRFGYSW